MGKWYYLGIKPKISAVQKMDLQNNLLINSMFCIYIYIYNFFLQDPKEVNCACNATFTAKQNDTNDCT